MCWACAERRPIIGPFKYKIRELAKAGVVVVQGAEMDGLISSESMDEHPGVELRMSLDRGVGSGKEGRSWMDGVVKMSCTSPGTRTAGILMNEIVCGLTETLLSLKAP